MAMSDYSLSDIAAVTDGVDGGNRNGGWGDGGWWILLLFILLGGWNGNRGFGGGAGQAGGNELYPWINQSENVNDGFRDQMVQTAIQGVHQGVNGLSTQLCNCCSDIQMALANGFAGVEAGANARQIANMQQAFAAQTAMTQGFNGLQSQFADCCCENRLGLANLTSTILSENCADRAAISDGIRDVLTSQNANTQRILDQMCQDKIDEKNEEIANLRQQVNMMNLAASQNLQTAQLMADNAAQTTALEQYLAPVPRPAYVVQNPNCCQQWQGCGCN